MAAHSFRVLFHAVFSIFMLVSKIVYINTSIFKVLAAGISYASAAEAIRPPPL